MRLSLRKSLALAVVTATLAGSVAPASAGGWGYGGGWGYRPGWGRPGWGYGGMAGAAASQGGYGYGYGGCYPVQTPVYDAWGDVVAYRRAEVCQ